LTLPARRFNSRLKVHVEIKEITYGLREKLRLAETSGRADGVTYYAAPEAIPTFTATSANGRRTATTKNVKPATRAVRDR
jgi:hypothetical protein